MAQADVLAQAQLREMVCAAAAKTQMEMELEADTNEAAVQQLRMMLEDLLGVCSIHAQYAARMNLTRDDLNHGLASWLRRGLESELWVAIDEDSAATAEVDDGDDDEYLPCSNAESDAESESESGSEDGSDEGEEETEEEDEEVEDEEDEEAPPAGTSLWRFGRLVNHIVEAQRHLCGIRSVSVLFSLQTLLEEQLVQSFANDPQCLFTRAGYPSFSSYCARPSVSSPAERLPQLLESTNELDREIMVKFEQVSKILGGSRGSGSGSGSDQGLEMEAKYRQLQLQIGAISESLAGLARGKQHDEPDRVAVGEKSSATQSPEAISKRARHH